MFKPMNWRRNSTSLDYNSSLNDEEGNPNTNYNTFIRYNDGSNNITNTDYNKHGSGEPLILSENATRKYILTNKHCFHILQHWIRLLFNYDLKKINNIFSFIFTDTISYCISPEIITHNCHWCDKQSDIIKL
eukprot:273114_1